MKGMHRDPSTMTAEERMAQMAFILATGYRRLSVNRPDNPLAASPSAERSCVSQLNERTEVS